MIKKKEIGELKVIGIFRESNYFSLEFISILWSKNFRFKESSFLKWSRYDFMSWDNRNRR